MEVHTMTHHDIRKVRCCKSEHKTGTDLSASKAVVAYCPREDAQEIGALLK